jgi:hypothetical protein
VQNTHAQTIGEYKNAFQGVEKNAQLLVPEAQKEKMHVFFYAKLEGFGGPKTLCRHQKAHQLRGPAKMHNKM